MYFKIFCTEIIRMGEKEEIESSWTELQELGSLSSPHQKVGKYPETPEAEFKEFKPRRWTAKNRIQLSAGWNLEHLLQFQVEPTMFEPRLKFETRLKIFKFGLRICLVNFIVPWFYVDKLGSLLMCDVLSAMWCFWWYLFLSPYPTIWYYLSGKLLTY